MQNVSKIKPVNWLLITTLTVLASILAISIFALADAYVENDTRTYSYGLIWLGFAVINSLLWLYRKDLVSLTFILISTTMAVSYLADYKGPLIAVPIVILFTIYGYVIFLNNKLSKNYRKLLNLAALPVNDIENGFSSRPLPAGEVQIHKSELMGFARFLKTEYIAIPYVDNTGVAFTIKEHPRFWFRHPDEAHHSYVKFNYDGKIIVNIARKDYKMYDSEYSFDEVCRSLADLFKSLYAYFQDGKSGKIKEMFDDNGR